jgi:hypothetical protein
VPRSFDEAILLAKALANSGCVPEGLKGNASACLMVVDQAMRWNMSALAVAQGTSFIKGKMMHEGKLVGAAVVSSGAIIGEFDYEFRGEGDDREIIVTAKRRSDGKEKSVTVKLKDARTTNEQWKKQPDQQLVYHGTRVWARRWTPAPLLGVYCPEEFGRESEFGGVTIEGTAADVQQESKQPQPESQPAENSAPDQRETIGEPEEIRERNPSPEPQQQQARPLAINPQPKKMADYPDDDFPDLGEGEPQGAPEYPFARRSGGAIYKKRDEWLGQWRAAFKAYTEKSALDKLAGLRDMNRGAFNSIADHDPAATQEVLTALDLFIQIGACDTSAKIFEMSENADIKTQLDKLSPETAELVRAAATRRRAELTGGK